MTFRPSLLCSAHASMCYNEHMKTIFFVRHGESESNAGPVYKGFDARLTEKGREQARLIARRCAALDFEVIISSTMPRALDTARAIASEAKKPIIESELFWERKRPSAQMGMEKRSPEAERINTVIFENFLVPGARHSDEENFEDLKARAGSALAYVVSRPEKRILVATHGIFMRMVLAHAVMGSDLTGGVALAFLRSFKTKNTGLTVLEHGDGKAYSPWEVLTWNDHAHLG